MKRVKIGPGVWSVGPLGEIEVTAEIRRQYIEACLTPPKLVDDKACRPARQVNRRPLGLEARHDNLCNDDQIDRR